MLGILVLIGADITGTLDDRAAREQASNVWEIFVRLPIDGKVFVTGYAMMILAVPVKLVSWVCGEVSDLLR